MNFTIEIELEDDGRWIAEVMVYGQTREEAIAKVPLAIVTTPSHKKSISKFKTLPHMEHRCLPKNQLLSASINASYS